MSDQEPIRPNNGHYVSRKVITDQATGRTQENYVMDPYGGRYLHAGENPQLDDLYETYGAMNTKFEFLGHVPAKETEKLIAYQRAWAALQRMAVQVPSLQPTADNFFAGYVLTPLTVYMGREGAAVMSENTNREVHVNQEVKKSRWSLRR